MSRLLQRAGLRFLLRHPWQYALSVAGVALGVAVVLGVDIAAGGARKAFDASRELVVGRATHQAVPADPFLADEIYTRLRVELGVAAAAPVLEGRIRAGGETFSLIGIDSFAEGPFRDYLDTGADGIDLTALLTRPGTVAMTRQAARARGLSVGSRVPMDDAAAPTALEIGALLELDDARSRGADGLLFADMAAAQELLGRVGQLSRIDLILDADGEQRVKDWLPQGLELIPTAAQASSLDQMTRAFRINLLALSLLALLVGAFLVYSTLSFLVVRRRTTFGTARSLGVAPGQLFRNTLYEALLVGVPGTLVGIVLGLVLGVGLTSLVLRTVDDLYFRVQVQSAGIPPLSLLKALLLGLGTSLLAAVPPAVEAARTAPRSMLTRASLERRIRRQLPWLAAGGLALAFLGWLLLRAGTDSLVLSFAGLFAVVVAAALCTPPGLAALMAATERMARDGGGQVTRLAARGVTASLSRTGVAVAALTVAISTVVGVGLMIASFRGSVDQWLQQTLTSDFYFAIDEAFEAGGSDVDAFVAELAEVPGVADVTRSQRRRLTTGDGQVRLWAVDPGSRDLTITFLEGDRETAVASFLDGTGVLLSEPFARKRGLVVGDTLSLPTPDGPRSWLVTGVFIDYSSDQGSAMFSLEHYRSTWNDPGLQGIGIMAEEGQRDVLRPRLESFLAAHAGLEFAANAEIRQISLEIFDRTFTITRVLQLLVGLVAFLGMLSALQALQLERIRELSVLRAVGWTPRGLIGLILGQTGLMGLGAGLLALPVGIILAALLVFVINARSFGWSMDFSLEPMILGQALLLSVVAALLAGAWPAWRTIRTATAAGLRDE
jgi:putative ABC transport system permease protein